MSAVEHEVAATPARVPKAKKTFLEDGSGLVLNFAHGKVLNMKLSELSDEILGDLVLHGLAQKVGDSYAGSESPEEAFQAASAVWEQLKAGDWRRAGEAVPRTTLLAEALSAVTGKTLEECQAVIDAMAKSDEENKTSSVKELRNHPAIAAQLAIQKAARAAEAAKKAQEKASTASFDLADLGI